MTLVQAIGGSENAPMFSDFNDPNFRITSIVVWSGVWIDAIGATYTDKRDPSSSLFQGPHGANGAPNPDTARATITFAPNEVLTSIDIGYGNWIDTITFHTNLGGAFTFGNSDNHTIDHGASIGVADPATQEIRVLYGQAGNYLNKIGIEY